MLGDIVLARGVCERRKRPPRRRSGGVSRDAPACPRHCTCWATIITTTMKPPTWKAARSARLLVWASPTPMKAAADGNEARRRRLCTSGAACAPCSSARTASRLCAMKSRSDRRGGEGRIGRQRPRPPSGRCCATCCISVSRRRRTRCGHPRRYHRRAFDDQLRRIDRGLRRSRAQPSSSLRREPRRSGRNGPSRTSSRAVRSLARPVRHGLMREPLFIPRSMGVLDLLADAVAAAIIWRSSSTSSAARKGSSQSRMWSRKWWRDRGRARRHRGRGYAHHARRWSVGSRCGSSLRNSRRRSIG